MVPGIDLPFGATVFSPKPHVTLAQRISARPISQPRLPGMLLFLEQSDGFSPSPERAPEFRNGGWQSFLLAKEEPPSEAGQGAIDLCPVKRSFSGALDPGPLQDNFFFQSPFMYFNFTNMPAPSCPPQKYWQGERWGGAHSRSLMLLGKQVSSHEGQRL